MIRHECAGVVYDTFASFEEGAAPGCVHAVLTRHGGVSVPPWATLNLGRFVGDDPAAVETNHERACAALGLRREQLVTVHQVHGNRVARASPADLGTLIPAADALISDTPGLALLLRFADCVPVLFYDPVRRAVGLAHAGWQGSLAGIAGKTALAMQEQLGSHAGDLRAGIGPSIGPCCCEMGPEVLAQFRAAFAGIDAFLQPTTGGRARLDLWRLNAWQLEQTGVTHIEVAGVCTVCHTQDYYSHRGEGGRTGRFGVLIALGEER